MMNFERIIELLESIDHRLKTGKEIGSFRGRNSEGWTTMQVGKSWFFERTITYTGAAQTIDLNISHAFQLNRIEQIWNDATSRDFSIRIFTDPSLVHYVELDTQTSNTALNRIIQAGIEYKYVAGSRLRFYFTNTTLNKTDTVRIQLDEL